MANSVQTAILKLRQGQVVGLPTETVYGLGVDGTNPQAIERLRQLKGREAGKPFQVMVANVQEAEKLAFFDARARDLAARYWPGALTLVLPARAGGTIGLRIPDHDILQRILRKLDGPLVMTSANPAGGEPALDEAIALGLFGAKVAYYVPGTSNLGIASTVVDATGPQLKILRQGGLFIA